MRLLIILLCLISTFLCWDFNQNLNYQFIVLLPLSLLFFGLLEKVFFKNLKKSYVYYVFYFQSLTRYCLIPVGVAFGNEIGNGEHSENGEIAVFFMIVELLFVFILFSHQNFKFKAIQVSNKVILVAKNKWLYLFVAIMFGVISLSGYFANVSLIWNLGKYVENVVVQGEEIETSSVGGLLFLPFKISLLLILASVIIRSNFKNNTKIFLVIAVIGLSSSFIVGISRFSILTFILPFYFIMATMVGEGKKIVINIGLLLLIIPVIMITSLAKFTRGDNVASTEDILNTSSLNAYFSGVGNVSIGIDAFENQNNKDYELFFFNDIFQNVPMLSKLTNDTYKSNFVFNKKIYGHSEWQTQIVPLNIAGLFHFNVLGIGIYSVLFLSLAFYFERKAMVEQYLPYKYVYYSLVLTLSMVFMINIGSVIATIVRTFVFIYLPFRISDQLYKLTNK